jgi:hypothetical protein
MTTDDGMMSWGELATLYRFSILVVAGIVVASLSVYGLLDSYCEFRWRREEARRRARIEPHLREPQPALSGPGWEEFKKLYYSRA